MLKCPLSPLSLFGIWLQIQQEKKYGAGKGYAVDLGRLDYVAFAKAFGATGGLQSLVGGGFARVRMLWGRPFLCGCLHWTG